jgi:hypothetical protein
MATVAQLCQKTIWLNDGRLEEFGSSDGVIQSYLNCQKSVGAEFTRDETEIEQAPAVFIQGARIRSSENKTVSILDAKRPFSIEIDYKVTSRTLVWVGFTISTQEGLEVMAATDGDVDTYASVPREPGVYTSVCYIPEGLFNARQYALSVYAARTIAAKVDILDYLENVIAFGVENPSGVGSYMPKKRVGVISPKLDWELRPAARGEAIIAVGDS